MRKVKIFPIGNIQYHVEYAVNKTALEDRINNWIAEEKAHVISITASIDAGLCVMFVLYEENNLKEIADNELLEDSINPSDFSLENIDDAIDEAEEDDEISSDDPFEVWLDEGSDSGIYPSWEAAARGIKSLLDSEYTKQQESLNKKDLNKVLGDL